MCDLTIASEDSVFGQVGPKVGSVDPGFGTAYLSRLIGERKAREMWYLCRQYSAAEALDMGLVNRVVPAEELDSEVERWCEELLSLPSTPLTQKPTVFSESQAWARLLSIFSRLPRKPRREPRRLQRKGRLISRPTESSSCRRLRNHSRRLNYQNFTL